MSDAACGPSNSLQQFKQQTQVDRTLQQDRLTGRQHPAQGFRSIDPNAGLLDPEFEAFQAGLPPPDFQSYQPHHQGPPPFQQAFPEPSQGPSWAGDFQRMSIASPPPMQQHQHYVGPSTSNWAQDFRSNVAQSAPRAQNSSPSPFAFQQRARYGMGGGFQSNFAQPAYAPAVQSKGKEAVTEQFDEAAFERAFDMAKEDMMVDETTTSVFESASVQQRDEAASLVKESQMSQESHQLNQNDLLDNQHDLHQGLDIGLDMNSQYFPDETLAQEQKDSDQNTRDDDDALAATAQELLEKVEHNQTDKFRNSQFLGLMRKLRDREVKVEGDKMVETVSATQIHPKRTLTPDSGYDSGANTPLASTFNTSSTSTPHNPTICKTPQCDVLQDHRWDHWESPYS
jgi:hypothetical protein